MLLLWSTESPFGAKLRELSSLKRCQMMLEQASARLTAPTRERATPANILVLTPVSLIDLPAVLILTLKQLPFSTVLVTRTPPRPPLLSLGLTYRRIPVLAIGNELYCDTSIASLALETIFSRAKGFKSIDGGNAEGCDFMMEWGSAQFWSDRTLFRLASGLLDWGKLDAHFIKDRSEYVGGAGIDPKKMVAARPMLESGLRSHLALVELALSRKTTTTTTRKFILTGSTEPSYTDITFYFLLTWLKSFQTLPHFFDSSITPYPNILIWMDSMNSLIKSARSTHPSVHSTGKAPVLTPAAATSLIQASPPLLSLPLFPSSPSSSTNLFSSSIPIDPLLTANWISLNTQVIVKPDDTGRVGTQGLLVGINEFIMVVELVGEGGGKSRMVVPRIGWGVAKA